MLLDLLGTKNPTFYNYFEETEDLYLSLVNAEKALGNAGCLKDHVSDYFKPELAYVKIDDDHMPFYERGKHY